MAVLGACSCCPSPARADAWTYGEVEGPAAWPQACLAGNRQSPINLKLPSVSPTLPSVASPPRFKYQSFQAVDVLNTGHGTMSVSFPAGSCSVIVGVQELELLQFHFHTPSEHTLAGVKTPMEVHLVHRNVNTGGLAVLGVMMERGGTQPNPCLAFGLAQVPQLAGNKVTGVVMTSSPLALLPASGAWDTGAASHYIHYSGSLTTPPCSQGVDWYVYTSPIAVPDTQILDFMTFCSGSKVFGGSNARPVQETNERPLEIA